MGELQLYLNLNAGRQLKTHQGLNAFLAGVENIDQSLVGAALELLTAVLVLMHCTKNGNDFLLGRKGNGAGNLSAVAIGGLHDFLSAGIDDLMIVGLQADPDHFFVCHCGFSSLVIVLSYVT